MSVVVILAALIFLIVVAYRGYSVIVFAPIAALGAVLLTDPSAVAPVFTGLFMDKMAGFVRLYFPLFMLGAIFGKLIEISGFAATLVAWIIRLVGSQRSILSIVLVTALLTYGGVSVFVVVFATYPFAAAMFRSAGIPKRLVPATIALGALTFTMDALPGTPQIQNIIPTSFFKTDQWAAPILGLCGSVFLLGSGLAYLEWRRRAAHLAGETYGENHINEPQDLGPVARQPVILALLPLFVVGVVSFAAARLIPTLVGPSIEASLPGLEKPLSIATATYTAIWSVEIALISGITIILMGSFGRIRAGLNDAIRHALAGAMLATMNTASEFGFGAVIAALPGFLAVRDGIGTITDPLANEAVTVTALAGITGSASGGLSIALGAMAQHFLSAAQAAGIPAEVLHRIASMASGGMDSLPHNGAVITLLAVTGLTHRQAYRDIFALTGLKTIAVFLVIGVYHLTGWV